MTPYLTTRVLISTAAAYCVYLEETDPTALALAATLHKMRDIKAWARDHITDLLAQVEALDAGEIENEYTERLRRSGFTVEQQPTLF